MEWNSPLSISSYVVNTSKGKKTVILLSTAPPNLGITKDDGKSKLGIYKVYDVSKDGKSKLGIYKVYDVSKGGTDITDQRMGFYQNQENEQ